MPIIEFEPISRVKPESQRLLQYSYNEHSQFGEDGIIAEILKVIGIKNSWCFEAGAWDGKHLSNTHALMKRGWSGIFVEGNREKMKDLRDTYGSTSGAHLISALIGIDDDNLDRLLAATPIPKDFDVFSLDIDGLDYYVWEALKNYRPRVAIVEFNPTVPNDVVFVQDKDLSLNQGCSLLGLIKIGKRKGYELVAVTMVNAIFVVKEEFIKIGITDNSIDSMYFPGLSGRIFQGYDGTIFTANLPRLMWSGREIQFEELQVLSPSERRFGDAPPLA